jgi:hypothetical protein
VSELKDISGVFLKKICIFAPTQPFLQPEFQCRANGMELFVINSAAVQTALFKFSQSYFGAYDNPGLIINGEKDANGVWSSTHPSETLFSGLKWSSDVSTTLGNCLKVQANAKYSPFYVASQKCEDYLGVWYYCQYY